MATATENLIEDGSHDFGPVANTWSDVARAAAKRGDGPSANSRRADPLLLGCGERVMIGEEVMNANPEGINQYSKGAHAATGKAIDAGGKFTGTSLEAAQKLNKTSYGAMKASEAGDSKKAMEMHGQAAKMHQQLADKAEKRGDHRVGAAHGNAAEAHEKAAASHEMSLHGG